MLSGGKAGLVSVEVLRKEQEENRRRERNNQPLEGWLSFLLLRGLFRSLDVGSYGVLLMVELHFL